MKKKLIALVLCLGLTFSFVACGKNGGNKSYVEFKVNIGSGGLGHAPIEAVGAKFEEAYADHEFPSGKKGIKFEVEYPEVNVNTDAMASEQYALYVIEDPTKYPTLIGQGDVMDVTEYVREKCYGEEQTLEDKIPEGSRSIYQQRTTMEDKAQRRYYATPGYEIYAGLSYDRDLWKGLGLFFAKPDADLDKCQSFESSLTGVEYLFTDDENSLSVGPNGIPGDQDDGMPSSFLEFVSLCDYLKEEYHVYPFMLSGEYPAYVNSMLHGLMTNLQGADQARADTNFTCNDYEVVVGYTDEPLFEGYDDIKKPIVAKVNITESTGYYTTWSLAKYYACALLQLAQQKEWFFTGVNGIKATHISIQNFFIKSFEQTNASAKGAMLTEFSYWYSETIKDGNDLEYEAWNIPNKMGFENRDIRWMPLPVNYEVTVTGEDGVANSTLPLKTGSSDPSNVLAESTKGDKYVAMDTYKILYLYNNRYKDDADMVEAIKLFIQFSYSDEMLNYYTSISGYKFALNYNVNYDALMSMNKFTKNLFELVNSSEIVHSYADNDTYSGNVAEYRRGWTDGFFNPSSDHGVISYNWMKQSGNDYKGLFEYNMLDADKWFGRTGGLEGRHYCYYTDTTQVLYSK